MRCDKCPAWKSDGNYEYPEYSCHLGIDDNDMIEFKDGYYGCRRKSLKKIEEDLAAYREIDMQEMAKYYEDFMKFVDGTYKG